MRQTPGDYARRRPQACDLVQRFREYVGARYAIAVGSCTTALQVPLTALGVGSGDEVVMSPLASCATANIIVRLGATPVFADVDTDYNISPDAIEEQLTPRTKAVIVTDYSGQPCRMDRILTTAWRRRLTVIEDGAQALGASYRSRKVGSICDVTVFYFRGPIDTAPAAAGIITTDSNDLARAMQALDPCDPGKEAAPDMQATRFPEPSCVDESLTIRNRYAKMYNDALRKLPQVALPFVWPDVRHAWQRYPLCLKPGRLAVDRDRFVETLRGEDVDASPLALPIHRHSSYQLSHQFCRGDFPVAERMGDSTVLLPLCEQMTVKHVKAVVGAVKRVVLRYGL